MTNYYRAYSLPEALNLFEYIQEHEDLSPDFRDIVTKYMAEEINVNDFCKEIDAIFEDAKALIDLSEKENASAKFGDDLRSEERDIRS